MTSTNTNPADVDSFMDRKTVEAAVAQYSAGTSSVLFTPGRAIDKNTSKLTTLAVVSLGLTEDRAHRLRSYLYSFQRLTQRCRIVVITDSQDLKSFRPFGWMVEHVLNRSTHECLSPHTTWEHYLHDRITSALTVLDVGVVHAASPDVISRAEHQRLCDRVGVDVPYAAMF